MIRFTEIFVFPGMKSTKELPLASDLVNIASQKKPNQFTQPTCLQIVWAVGKIVRKRVKSKTHRWSI